MKLTDLLQNTRVDEAPLGDYELVGNWGDKEKSHGFRHATDRKMLQNPIAVKVTRKKFGNTEHVLNFYFVNLPEASSHSETGFMTPEQIQESMPKAWPEIAKRAQAADHENSINVLFVGNTGFQRMNMTPWLMAHRMAHALQAAERGYGYGQNKRSGPWGDYQRDATDAFQPLLEQVYNWSLSRNPNSFWSGEHDKTLAKFLEGIGGMRSTRKGKLGGRPYEFLYEMFAQHVITGRLTFRELPQSFGMRNSYHYRIQDQEVAEMYNRDLNEWISDQLGSYIDNTLYSAEGKFLVM